MSWTARCTVQTVSEGPAPIDVQAAAQEADVTNTGDDHVSGVNLSFKVNDDTTHLAVGSVITVEADC